MVSVILVTYNSEKFIKECLDALIKQNYNNIEIIVIDNNSQDNTKNILNSYKKLNIIKNKSNMGFAESNNAGYRISKGEYILTLNHDVVLEQNYIKNIVNFLKEKDSIASAQGILYRNKSKTKIDSCGIYLNIGGSANDIKRIPKENKEILACCAAATVYKKHIIDEIGFFDTSFISYYEDVDLGIRISIAGYKNYCIPSANAIHYRGSTQNINNLTLSLKNKYKILRKYKKDKIVIAKIYDILKFPIYRYLNKEFSKKYLKYLKNL